MTAILLVLAAIAAGGEAPPVELRCRTEAGPFAFEAAEVMLGRLKALHVEGTAVADSEGVISVRYPADKERADRIPGLLTRTGSLEFRVAVEPPPEPGSPAPRGTRWVPAAVEGGKSILVEIPSDSAERFDEADLERSTLALWREPGGTGRGVEFDLLPSRRKEFARFTGRILRRQLAIVLDGRWISAPIVQQSVSRTITVYGRFSEAEASDLLALLSAGPLPAPVEPVDAVPGPEAPGGQGTRLVYGAEAGATILAAAEIVLGRLREVAVDARVAADTAGRIEVTLPADVEAAALPRLKSLISRPGAVEFLAVSPDEEPDGKRFREVPSASGGESLVVEIPEEERMRFGNEDVDSSEVKVVRGPTGQGYAVQFAVRSLRIRDFKAFTGGIRGRRLAIVVDGKWTSAPVVREPLPGRAVISGGAAGFGAEEALDLVALMQSVPLPETLTLIEEK